VIAGEVGCEAGVVDGCGAGTSDGIGGCWKEVLRSSGVGWELNSKCEKSLRDISLYHTEEIKMIHTKIHPKFHQHLSRSHQLVCQDHLS
jgi:hypothetical protein